MRRLTIGFAAACAAVAGHAVAAEPAKVGDLGWISGQWIKEDNGRWTEESWTSSRGGVLLGNSKSGQGERTIEFELLRIAPDDKGVITYWASPGGRAPTPFPMTESSSQSATFENPTHDYPTRIEYRRDGDKMTAKISGANGANPLSWTFSRRGD